MLGVLTGCGIIALVVLIGYLLARLGVLDQGADYVLNRVAFFVATPAVIFKILSESDLHVVLSGYMLVAALCVVVCAGIYLLVSRILFKRPLAETTIGLASVLYVNSNNMGVPVAVYVLGDPGAIAAVLLLQPIVLSPIALTLLDLGTNGRPSVWRVLTQPFRSPIILAAGLGLLVAFFGWTLPPLVQGPVDLLAGASIPVVLLAFGFSLRGQRSFRAGTGRRQVLFAAVMKSLVMPAVAYLVAGPVLHLPSSQVFATVVVAALPTGQVIYNYAARFGVDVVIVRDTVLLTTIAAVPVMLLATALLT